MVRPAFLESPRRLRTRLASTAAGTSSGGSSGGGSHSHGLGQIPDYQPAGQGNNYVEIAFIKATKTRSYSQVGFITGDSQTFAGIQNAYIGVYLVNPTTGNLTLCNTSSATTENDAPATPARPSSRGCMSRIPGG